MSFIPFLLLSTMQKYVEVHETKTVNKSKILQLHTKKIMNIETVDFNETDSYSGFFSVLIHTISSEANNSNIPCMSEVTKYHCIIIHKVLSIHTQKPLRCVQTFFNCYLWWPATEKQTSYIAITQWLKKQNSVPEDSVYIPAIQISQKNKEINIGLSWGIGHKIKSPTIMP